MAGPRGKVGSGGAKGRTVFAETSGRWIVRASSPQFFGVRCNVQFRDGVGRTDNPTTALELETMGFAVTDSRDPSDAGGSQVGLIASNAADATLVALPARVHRVDELAVAPVGLVLGHDHDRVDQAGDVEEQAEEEVQESLNGLPTHQHGDRGEEDREEVHGGNDNRTRLGGTIPNERRA